MWQFIAAVEMEIHWNTVITIDVFSLLGSEIYLFWLIDWLVDWLIDWLIAFIFQIFIPNNVKNSWKYPLLTLGTDFDTSFTVQLYQVSREWPPSCACAVFLGSKSRKIVNFCYQYSENFSNTVILLVSLNIILWH